LISRRCGFRGRSLPDEGKRPERAGKGKTEEAWGRTSKLFNRDEPNLLKLYHNQKEGTEGRKRLIVHPRERPPEKFERKLEGRKVCIALEGFCAEGGGGSFVGGADPIRGRWGERMCGRGVSPSGEIESNRKGADWSGGVRVGWEGGKRVGR